MSASPETLCFMADEKLIELAQEQAALTLALAERLEMAKREIEDLQFDTTLEFDNGNS